MVYILKIDNTIFIILIFNNWFLITMGIKNLMKVKVKNAKSDYNDQTIADIGRSLDLKELADDRVCIDTSYIIYSSILAMQHVAALTDEDGRTTSHILTILNKVLNMKKQKLSQVWIFDSPKVNPLKRNELANRDKKRDASSNEKVQFKMTGEHVTDVQDLLKYLGILYIVAPDGIEAEQYGALLTMGESSERYCKYMISGDTDVLLFGGNLLKPVPRGGGFVAFEVNDILEEMEITRDQFVKMGLALGSDFAQKTPGLGPSSVHTKARYNKIPLTDEQKIAYDYFMQDVEMTEAHMVESTYDREALLDFLVGRGFNRERYEKRIDAAFKPKKAKK